MYRVVTKARHHYKGLWRQLVDAGPWHPQENHAQKWAQYLSSTGLYDIVEVESNVRDPGGGFARYRM